MIWASGIMSGSSTPNALQDGTAAKKWTTFLIYYFNTRVALVIRSQQSLCKPRHFLFLIICTQRVTSVFVNKWRYLLPSDSGPHTKLRTLFFCSNLWPKYEEGHESEQKKKTRFRNLQN